MFLPVLNILMFRLHIRKTEEGQAIERCKSQNKGKKESKKNQTIRGDLEDVNIGKREGE